MHLQPCAPAESWLDPVMPVEHLARHLRISRLVSPDQSKRCEPPKEEKSAEGKQEKPIGNSQAIVQLIRRKTVLKALTTKDMTGKNLRSSFVKLRALRGLLIFMVFG